MMRTVFMMVMAFMLCGMTFSPDTRYSTCFTPGNDCTGMIVDEIVHARHSVHVQAFSFTSAEIRDALLLVYEHGIDVEVIVDRSEEGRMGALLASNGMPVWIDYKPAIAHNKVMIIDDDTVITGSFNFTAAAQHRNAENVLVIHDRQLAATYLANWMKRQSVSRRMPWKD